MASKSRGGLSKPEYARAQAAKAKAAPKPVTRKVSPLMGVGPLQPGQQRAQSNQMDTEGYTQDIYNALPSNSPAKVSAASDAGNKARAAAQRNMAAKAQKSSGGSSTPNQTYRPMVAPTPYNASQDTLSGGDTSLLGGIKREVGKAVAGAGNFLGDMVHAPDLGISESLGVNKFMQNYGFGIPTANAADNQISRLGMALQKGSQPDIPTGYGDKGEIFYNNADPRAEAETQRRRQAINDPSRMSELFGVPTAQASTMPYQTTDNAGGSGTIFWDSRKNNFDPSFMGNGEGDANESYYQDPVRVQNDYDQQQEMIRQQQNEAFGGGPGPVDTPAPRVTNQLRGSGMFGTGKGVGNPAGDDSYIKELRKAYSSNGGEKWLRQQFEELIKALDPTYAQMQTEGTNALNENLRNSSNQLASVMNAGNVGDSEQRTQQLAGLQNTNTTAIGALLAKLAQGKAGDVSQYKSQQYNALAQNAEKQKTNKQRLMEQIQQYRQQQYSNRYNESEAARKSQPRVAGASVPNVAESEVYKVQRELGISRTQALKLLQEEARVAG